MEMQRAKEILAILADGVNPVTGELLPEDDSCNQAEVVRALYTVLSALEVKPQTEKKLPPNTGKAWTTEEEQNLVEGYHAGVTIVELAKKHGRTRGAITSRLEKLGEIQLLE